MPLTIGTALGLGSTVLGGLLSSSSKDDAAAGANDANQTAINEAKARAAIGYGQNTATIQRTGENARSYIDQGYEDTKAAFKPIIDQGDQARQYYGDATGLNGEGSRDAYIKKLLARPEFAAARELVMKQQQQQFGSKLGSGAFARAMAKKDLEYANTSIDRDLSRIKPVVDAGNQARWQGANAATNYGNNQGANEWKVGTTSIQNENAFTDNMMNAALASGASNASFARSQGDSDAALFSGLGNAFAAAFGGSTGTAKQPFSSIFS